MAYNSTSSNKIAAITKLWIENKQAFAGTSSKSFYFENDIIYSFGTHYPIAKRKDDVIYFNNQSNSNTTNKQRSIVKYLCSTLCPNSIILETNNVYADFFDINSYYVLFISALDTEYRRRTNFNYSGIDTIYSKIIAAHPYSNISLKNEYAWIFEKNNRNLIEMLLSTDRNTFLLGYKLMNKIIIKN